MGWLWRTATGTEWDEAVPALRMYWQSHRTLLLRLLLILTVVALLDAILAHLHLHKIRNPILSGRELQWYLGIWGNDSYVYFLRPVWPFVLFMTYCFYRLPTLPVNPSDVTRPFLLPQRIWILIFAGVAGVGCSIAFIYWNALGTQDIFPALGFGLAAILVPTVSLLGIKHTSIPLNLITQVCLWIWVATTLLVDLVQWAPTPLDDSVWLPAGLTLALPALLLMMLFYRRTRAVAFGISCLGFLLVTVFSTALDSNVSNAAKLPCYLIHSGVVGLGRDDPTYTFIVGVTH